jgi:methylglyoxal synthase
LPQHQGYEIFPQKSTSTDDAWIETNETLLHRSSETYEVDIDDKDLHIDMKDVTISREEQQQEKAATMKTSSTDEVESTLKRKSQQSLDAEANKKKKKDTQQKGKKKRSGKTSERRTTKLNSREEVAVIETTSPWVTTDPSITADISLEQRQLIEFYVNPLQELPHQIDIRWAKLFLSHSPHINF